ncbi:MAG: ABC transporter permease subunit [Alphaproteobacteria bacterium]
MRAQAAAGACLLLALTLAAMAVWLGLERACAAAARAWRGRGRRADPPGLRPAAGTAMVTLVLLAMLASAGMLLWSVAGQWRFPDSLPAQWSIARWAEAGNGVARPFLATLAIGAGAVAVALVAVLACLENEDRAHGAAPRRALWLLYAPLLVPQVCFLFGVQQLLVRLQLDGHWLAVLWSHLLFVLPYVYLSMAEPARALDPRYRRAAVGLGASPWRQFARVRLPLLLRATLVAAAVGFSVSVAQYLPTVFAGAGRIVTLTTEAVTLSAGGDRRLIGIHAVLQSALPFAGFALAAAVPALLFRNRLGMRAGW